MRLTVPSLNRICLVENVAPPVAQPMAKQHDYVPVQNFHGKNGMIL